MTKRICIILPALNEESTVGEVIGEIPIKEIERKGYQTSIIVVDNGSTDRTRDVAKKGVRFGLHISCQISTEDA